MTAPRADRLVACRTTHFERLLVEALAARQQRTMSDVVRDAVLSCARRELEMDAELETT